MYIEEAHPTNLWQVSSNVRDGVEFASPQSATERAEIAATCVLRLAVKIPSLLDGMGNEVERAYTGWPDRLYIVDTGRRVRFKSAPGPFGFSTEELEDELERVLH